MFHEKGCWKQTKWLINFRQRVGFYQYESFHSTKHAPVLSSHPPSTHPNYYQQSDTVFHSHVSCCHKSSLPIGQPAGLRALPFVSWTPSCAERVWRNLKITRGYLAVKSGTEVEVHKLPSHNFICMSSEKSSAQTRKSLLQIYWSSTSSWVKDAQPSLGQS